MSMYEDTKHLQEEYYKRLEQRIEEFAHNIPFNELFSYIKKQTGLDDLSFNVSFKQTRDNKLRPEFESQDLVDKVGFLNLLFSTLVIGSFNSSIIEDKPKNWENFDFSRDYPLYYFCTVDFSYNHPGGGSNGKTWLSAWYQDSFGWTYRLEA